MKGGILTPGLWKIIEIALMITAFSLFIVIQAGLQHSTASSVVIGSVIWAGRKK